MNINPKLLLMQKSIHKDCCQGCEDIELCLTKNKVRSNNVGSISVVWMWRERDNGTLLVPAVTTSATGAEDVGEATGDSRHDEESEREAPGSDVRHPAQISATVRVDNGQGGVIVLPRCRSKLRIWMLNATESKESKLWIMQPFITVQNKMWCQ